MASVLTDVPRFPFSLDRLIAEAKRRARQRRLAATVLVLAMVVAGAALALRVSDRVAALAGHVQCRDGQIGAKAVLLPGATQAVGRVIRYRDLSSSACTLSGYPTVSISAAGLSEIAAHGRAGMLGGLSSRRTSLPLVLLHDKNALASSTVEFVPAATADSLCPGKKHPLVFSSISVTVPDGQNSLTLPVSTTAVCSQFPALATPIVPGGTGRKPTRRQRS